LGARWFPPFLNLVNHLAKNGLVSLAPSVRLLVNAGKFPAQANQVLHDGVTQAALRNAELIRRGLTG
jgi:hypothetical protein